MSRCSFVFLLLAGQTATDNCIFCAVAMTREPVDERQRTNSQGQAQARPHFQGLTVSLLDQDQPGGRFQTRRQLPSGFLPFLLSFLSVFRDDDRPGLCERRTQRHRWRIDCSLSEREIDRSADGPICTRALNLIAGFHPGQTEKRKRRKRKRKGTLDWIRLGEERTGEAN